MEYGAIEATSAQIGRNAGYHSQIDRVFRKGGTIIWIPEGKLRRRPYLVEEEIRVELAACEVVPAAGAVVLVVEVRHDAHVAEAVAAGREERVLDHAHANRAQQIPVAAILSGHPRSDATPAHPRSGGLLRGQRRRRRRRFCR